MRPTLLSLLVITVFAVSMPTRASDDFRGLWDAAWRGQISRVESALETSASADPLRPYLEYALLRQPANQTKDSDVAAFLSRHQDTPLANQLRRYWLTQLAEQAQWGRFIAFWAPGMGTELDCHYARAWLAMPQELRPADHMDQIRDLWLVPHSQPESCDPAFSHWLDLSPPSPDVVWQRIEMAVAADNLRLARYLQRFLPDAQRPDLELWLAMRSQPEREIRRLINNPADRHQRSLLTFGLDRLNSRDPEASLQLLDAGASNQISEFDHQRIRARAVLLLHTRYHEQADQLLDSLPVSARSQTLLEWSVRQALRQQDWPQVIERIGALDAENRQRPVWLYWLAHAQLQLGQDTDAAEKALHALAGQANYYGFLAADELGLGYALCDQGNSAGLPADASLAPSIAIERALLLYRAGLTNHARREWAPAIRQLDDQQKASAAALADAFGWHHAAILALANAGHWHDYTRRFPLLHTDSVQRHAAQNGLNPAFVMAIIRAESAFQADARSPADALGLMQLTIPTAQALARRNGQLTYRNRWQLIDPETNIAFGSFYLRRLFDRFSPDYWAVMAGYNAGPNIAERWRRETRHLPLPVTLETLPYHETREYIQRVTAFSIIYDWQMQRPVGRLSSRLHASNGRQVAEIQPAQCESVALQIPDRDGAITSPVLAWRPDQDSVEPHHD